MLCRSHVDCYLISIAVRLEPNYQDLLLDSLQAMPQTLRLLRDTGANMSNFQVNVSNSSSSLPFPSSLVG